MVFSYVRSPAPPENHFYGWGYIIETLKSRLIFKKNAPVLDTWADSYHDDHQLCLLKNNQWVGILHSLTSESRDFNLNRFFSSQVYNDCVDNCILLLTTSEHSRKYCLNKTSIPVKTLLHPKLDTGHYFNLNKYLNNPILRHSGFFGRNIKKFIDFNSNIPKQIYCDRPSRLKTYTAALNQRSSIEFFNGYLEKKEYINTFTKSIGYSYYDDCSASNSILEHIMTRTPLLVNRLPAIEEYIGADYPMFLDDMPENIDSLLTNRNFLEDVSSYLGTRSKKKEFSLDYFIDFFNDL